MMKRLFLPLALAAALSLSGCIGHTFLSTSTATPAEANTTAAASHLLLAAQSAADAYVKSPSTTQANREKAAKLSHDLRGYLDTALDAEAHGNSAAVATALQAFNRYFPQFSAIVGGPK